MKPIADYQILDHGVESSQYFQGCGTTFTEYTDVATGIGESPAEALEDALDQLACSDWDVSTITDKLSEENSVCPDCDLCTEEGCASEDGCEMHHFISVRVK